MVFESDYYKIVQFDFQKIICVEIMKIDRDIEVFRILIYNKVIIMKSFLV